MNSVVQCMSHLPPLRNFFLSELPSNKCALKYDPENSCSFSACMINVSLTGVAYSRTHYFNQLTVAQMLLALSLELVAIGNSILV